ncbi:1-acyl-sn-glycerol-3-phosphate-acyltransferase [Mycena metata]|uniref:1-acyl-sn-glycerol-3-phosphate acyltransferase n=1 Tax=Mycena metata TaxID=1033252 RepID=A0AAD7N5E7_9AGAR|nr:1-acyl-sn-glycerol-3-phosphate-acyltransferase [Mycena metata]
MSTTWNLSFFVCAMLVVLFVCSKNARHRLRIGIYFAVMCLWGFGGTPVSFAMALFGRRFEVGRLITASFAWVVGLILGLRVDLEGAEHLATQPAVLMLNHQSALDVWLLGRIFPKRVSVMAKKSLGWSPIGPVLYLSGAIMVERGTGVRAVASIREAGVKLRDAGVSLMVFPEGTRNGARTPSLLPFKKGGFHLAVQSGLPIVPIVCENYSHMYRRGYFEPVTLKVRVLPPILTAELSGDDVSTLTTRVHDQMLAAVREISRPAQVI